MSIYNAYHQHTLAGAPSRLLCCLVLYEGRVSTSCQALNLLGYLCSRYDLYAVAKPAMGLSHLPLTPGNMQSLGPPCSMCSFVFVHSAASRHCVWGCEPLNALVNSKLPRCSMFRHDIDTTA